jgi:hypothetical protein
MNLKLLAQGQIINPVLGGTLGTGGNEKSGVNVAILLGTFIRVMVIIGSLGFVLYFVIGAVNWITSGGDKGKLETAKQSIINALTGLVILLALVAITTFLKDVFQIDLLNIIWPTPGGAVPTTTP